MSALALPPQPDLSAGLEPDYDVQAERDEANLQPAAETADAPKVLKLEEIAGQGIDLAFVLPDDVLMKIASECLDGYERDKSEREEWDKDYDKTAAMLGGKRETKSFPWPGASNVVYPLIATASLQFGARAYPAIVKGQDVAKARVIGEDPDGTKVERGTRIKEHMNWQLLEEMPEWEDETDKLVHMLPWQGCLFRQAVWDKTYSRPLTSLISAKRLVVTQAAKDLETVPLFTKEFDLFPYQVRERMRDKRYVDLEGELKFSGDEKQEEQLMLECHCRYDLDDDDYEEPYIAVIHHETGKLMSLKAGFWPAGVEREQGAPDPLTGEAKQGRVLRVRRHVEFTKYDFVPDFEGKFLGIGFGFLLREHNAIISTLINQLIDAGTDQNTGGGFIGKGVNIKGGSLSFEPGEWKMINTSGNDLRSNIVARTTSQPSEVLFKLLGLMIEAGKELASIRDALTGEVAANQPATTTLAIIEQGLQVFSSIYKRIYRSLGKELKLIYQLNGAYLPDQQYFQVLDDRKAIARQDYAAGDHDVVPVADPSITTSAQRLAKAQFLDGYKGNPDVDQRELVKRQMQAAEIEDIEKLMPEPDKGQAMMKQQQALMIVRKMLADIRAQDAASQDKEASAKLKDVQAGVAAHGAMLDAAATIAEIESIRLTGATPDGGNDPSQGPAPPQAGPDAGGGMGGVGGMAGPPQDPTAAGGPQIPRAAVTGVMDRLAGIQPQGGEPQPPGMGAVPGLPGAGPAGP